MESLFERNQALNKEMVGLMKEKNENDEKMVQLIGELYEISGGNRSKIEVKSVFEVDENENDVERVESFTKVKSAPISTLGLTGCLANIARYVLAGILSLVVERSGLNRVLGLFGATLKPVGREDIIVDKRKLVDDGDLHIGEDENKLKRRRCDTEVKCWLEEDVDIKKVDLVNDESLKAFDDSYWSKKPIINFVNDKVAGIKTISDSEDLICNLSLKSNPRTKIYVEDTDQLNDTGKKVPITPSDSFEDVVNDNRLMIEPSDSFGDNINKDLTGYQMSSVETSTPLSLDQVTGLFVFSASKKADVSEEDHAEQSMLSLMTFEEKKIYFAKKIKEEEAAALRGSNTPCKLAAEKSPGPKPYSGSKSPMPPKIGSKLQLPQHRQGNDASPVSLTEAYLSPLPLQTNRSISAPWMEEIAAKSPLRTVLPEQGEPEQPLLDDSRVKLTIESKEPEQ